MSLVLVLCSFAHAAQDPKLSFRIDAGAPTKIAVAAEGLDPLWLAALDRQELQFDRISKWFRLFIESSDSLEHIPIIATYSVDHGALVLGPRFPAASGATYRAELELERAPGYTQANRVLRLVASYQTPMRKPAPPTRVVAVYPSARMLPENTLKFYIHFSASMRQGEAYRSIRLLDPLGKPVEDAFLEIGEELWNRDGTRLTILFDPGRIKRGLKPREEQGPILESGKTYTLSIDSTWLDAAGNRLACEFKQTFRAGPEDLVQPDPKNWVLKTPTSATEPLVLVFPEPLDHALLQRCLSVRTKAGATVEGACSIDRDDTRWSFQPIKPWQPGDYRVSIVGLLEDLAGNSIERPFEVDVFVKANRPTEPVERSLSFSIARFRGK